ncbi:MAG: type II toxin-antitoxin system RelE/ParE family toxin [Sulfitobacter sp.]
MKPFRLTRQAEDHLTDIAIWTFETFGPRQSDAYEDDLILRCEQIANGTAPHQSCKILVDGIKEDLRFTRAGQHFIVFLENDDEVIIVDFLHSRSDLPAKIAHLESRSS